MDELTATSGTARYLKGARSRCRAVNKVLEGRPHCVDAIISKEVGLVINTTEGAAAISDSFSIRRESLTNNVPHYTTIAAAAAAVEAIETLASNDLEVAPCKIMLKSWLS